MSDFDKQWADKLNEPENFPNRDKNWSQLSERLDHFQSHRTDLTRQVRYWKAAAAVLAIATTGFCALWANSYLRHQRLLENQAQIQSVTQQVAPITSDLNTFSPSEAQNSPSTTFTVPESGGHSDLAAANTKTSPENTPTNKQTTAAEKSGQLSTHNYAPVKSPSNKRAVPAAGKLAPSSADAVAADEPAGTGVSNAATTTNNAVAALPPTSAGSDKHNNTAIELLPAAEASLLLPQAAVLPLQSVATTPTPVNIAHRRFRPSLQLGPQFGLGIKNTVGVNQVRSAGLLAECNILPGLMLSASADWQQYRLTSQDTLPDKIKPGGGHHPHNPPGPQQPDHRLTEISGDLRQQQFSLGLRYALPLRGRISPSLRLAHVWLHEKAGLLSYEFEDPDPHGPGPGPHAPEKYILAERTEAAKTANWWRAGAGLDVKVGSGWTAQVGVDYMFNTAGVSGGNAEGWYARGGVVYQLPLLRKNLSAPRLRQG
ncbi:MAG: hypothetical protein J0L99_05300 [Chitinophagales bacterium]|nr:hypothetical protein [Chitinophagales bacterium]